MPSTFFDPATLRQDFPLLSRTVHGKPLVYLDNAATAQKPRQVLEALTEYYQHHNANVHRGVHALSDEATALWEESRNTIAKFFGADPEGLIMTRNTTESLCGIAYGWGRHNLAAGDVVVTSVLEHHSNIVVWQELCREVGAELVFCQVTPDGQLDLEHLSQLLQKYAKKVRLITLVHVSNTTGAVLPIEAVVKQVREHCSPTTRISLDSAQAAAHLPITFTALGVDFMAVSGHKMLGPMGAGVLLVRPELLTTNEFQPWLFGGGMISAVSVSGSSFQDDHQERFTAGTPDVASAVGLARACQYLTQVGMEDVAKHDQDLVQYAHNKLKAAPQLTLVGPEPKRRVGSVAFMYQGVHAHDVAQVLDSEGIAVRSGHHCTMPLHQHFGWQATVRVSFQIYNTKQEVDAVTEALKKVELVFGKTL